MRSVLLTVLPAAAALALPAAAQTPTHLLGENPGSRFGTAVALAGDLDGDGAMDVVVGAPADDTNGAWAGSVSAISLAKEAVLWRHYGKEAGDKLGSAVCGAGDVDGDGYADVLVGIPFDSTAVGKTSGSARLLSGMNGKVIYPWPGFGKFDEFGTSVAGGGDVDLDGVPDMLVGSPWGGDADPLYGLSDQGEVHVILGGCLCRKTIVEGEYQGDTFGTSVAFLGDVDFDGVTDWAAGAPFGQTEGLRLGYVQVRAGREAALFARIHGPQDGALFGASVAGLGDADHDGRPDLVVGAPYWSQDGKSLDGRAQAFRLLPWAPINDVVGTAGSEFGTSVAGVGDASGDGAADFAVGAYRHSTAGMNQRGTAIVWRGNLPQILDAWVGEQSAAHLGRSVAGLGDLDGDGRPEVLVGVPQDDTAGLHAGAVVVRSVK